MRLIALAALALLAACSTPSPYRDNFTTGVGATVLPTGEIKVISVGDGPAQQVAAWALRRSAEATIAAGKTHFQVTSVRFGSGTVSVLVELIIQPLDKAMSGKGYYEAAAVKREADAFAASDMKVVPPGLMPVAVENNAVVDKS